MDRRCVNDPTTDARTVSSLSGLLNPVSEVSAQFRSGMMKSGLGYDRFFRDQTVIKHTTGTFSAGGTVNGGNQTTGTGGGNITVNAITGTLKQGDIITFADVNAVNRVTKESLGTLRQFVVTADVANGAGKGGGPHVKAFDQQGNVIASFYAYDSSFMGGVDVAAGDINGDGKDEIITGAGKGGGPHVKAFDSSGAVTAEFFAYVGTFNGGVKVSAFQIPQRGAADTLPSPSRGPT
jgi:hypothetical protein